MCCASRCGHAARPRCGSMTRSAAPKFPLLDQEAKTHTLANYRGRWVVLYFYPNDDTPGCTTEACNFRDNLPALRALNVQILGISMDDTKSHARFAEKYRLPFPLLADTEGDVTRAYGALWSMGPIALPSPPSPPPEGEGGEPMCAGAHTHSHGEREASRSAPRAHFITLGEGKLV